MSAYWQELIDQAMSLEDNRNDLWTWVDVDPDVAWDDPESYHGKLAELYADAGWERCYHRDARFHFNVKLNGDEAWRRFRDLRSALERERNGLLDADAFDALADHVQECELGSWWESTARDFRCSTWIKRALPGVRLYSCGRSGGYLNADAINDDPVAMIELARHCQESRDYYTSAEWAEALFKETVERYDAEALEALASPRESTWAFY